MPIVPRHTLCQAQCAMTQLTGDINPTTTFIANHNTPLLTYLFGYHVSVPGYELRVKIQINFPINNTKHATRNPKQYRMTQKKLLLTKAGKLRCRDNKPLYHPLSCVLQIQDLSFDNRYSADRT